MAQIKVYVNDSSIDPKGELGTYHRRLINVELLEDRKTTILVRLPDGEVITRKKKRDLPNSEVSNGKA
jgi:hypothetical protein